MAKQQVVEAGKLRHKVELWHNVKVKNEVNATSNKPEPIRTIWCEIIPQSGSTQTYQADTVISKCTHKVIIRYLSGKDIKTDMWFMYRGHRLDIKYIIDDFSMEKREIFCEEVVE
ncbi:phage head closure protein [Paenibacillus thailandensis]|uniref:Phage head closure protein n=1 Tax=Paenibacillus thailandensis TaxID=393250 RepID=A0ABW5R3I0_9BACL